MNKWDGEDNKEMDNNADDDLSKNFYDYKNQMNAVFPLNGSSLAENRLNPLRRQRFAESPDPYKLRLSRRH